MMTQTTATPSQTETETPFTLMLDLQAADFQDEWSRCNSLANYIGEYTAYQFTQRERAENLISTIANELLETAVNLTADQSAVNLSIAQDDTLLKVIICHKIEADKLTSFQSFVETLTPTNPQLYLDLLTNETEPTPHFNQLGLAMLAHDFGVTVSVGKAESGEEMYCTTIKVSNEGFST